MTDVGQREIKIQQRLVQLFQDGLHYEYLGNFQHKSDNKNILAEHLERFLLDYQDYDETQTKRGIDTLTHAADDTSKTIYDRNKAVYSLLRYGAKVKSEHSEHHQTVHFIDWKQPERNRFAIAEEVTVKPHDTKAHTKRPDIVIYVNGIALGIIELKRSSVSVAEGIRQHLDNQKPIFIEHFFSTIQWLMAGNDSEGLRYGTTETKEKYYLAWKEEAGQTPPGESALDTAIKQICQKERFLELIHNFVVFDKGTKKVCRHNQYFGVKAAQARIKKREGGIIWHTQGSGKSLTMVWLARWIRENQPDARVLIITDRTELDEQIEDVFDGVDETIHRTKSGTDLMSCLNDTTPWLMCSLVHKFGSKKDKEASDEVNEYINKLKASQMSDFKPKGNLYIFVDECHRTQSGELHKSMTSLLPDALFIGFTGTPLLKADKKKSIEIFGGYIHTYKFNEAVRDEVVLDLRYEARDIDQLITSPGEIDTWFEANTKGLTDHARTQLKKRWGTLQKVLSSRSRLEQIVKDIMMDMVLRDRLKSGRGNAMLVAGSIYQACKLYDLFSKTHLKGKCAIVTSYNPTAASIKGEETGEGNTEKLHQYDIYKAMLADWFREPPEDAVKKVEKFELQVKKKFVDEPGQMKLLIVVDKLLTGFDAPSATYLYIDKHMRDHGLFQAICRVNRLDGEDKEYGYIIDYKDLFKSLEGAVQDYTSNALDGYDKDDVAGLLENRLDKGKERLDDALEAIRALCEQVNAPRKQADYFCYFSSTEPGDADRLKQTEPRREKLYKLTSSLLRAYANLANEMEEAGYGSQEIKDIRQEVKFYEQLRSEVKLHSGDAIDLKMYEPAMRHLIDAYIKAADTEVVSAFDDMSLIQLIVERGPDAVEALPGKIKESHEAVAETIENNVRKLIIEETPVNPKYYESMSELLDALIEQRRQDALDYQDYLEQIVQLTRDARNGPRGSNYPASLDTPAKRALFDNLEQDEALALAVDQAVRSSRQDAWRDNKMKIKRVKLAIKQALDDDERLDEIVELAFNQHEY